MAAAALIGLPSAGFAQTAAPQTPPSQTSPAQTTPTPTSTQGQTASSSATSPADHIREAKQALASIPSSAVPEASRGKLGQLKTHLNNLDKLVAKGGETATSGTTGAKKGASSWGTEAAAVDKLVSELSAEATDDAAKQKLMEVRRHVTEVAGSMSGTGSTGQDQASSASSSSSPDTMGANPSASQQSTPTSAAANPTANPTPSATDPTAAGATQSPSSAATQSPSSAATQSPSSAATQSPSSATNPSAAPQSTAPNPSTSPQSTPSDPSAAQQPPAAGQPGQVDVQAAKQHLSDARDSLAQLTSLPEASKLQGDARNQVAQLISNFNELITTQTDWKAAYGKVTANVDTLIGPDSSSPAAATGMSGTTGAPATAGTTGAAGAAGPAMQIDPAIKAKLQEFRTHLKAFEQSAGGGTIQSAASSQTPGAMAPSANPSSTSSPATGPSTPSAASTTPEPTNAPMPTGTSGSSTPSAAGTSGSAAPAATDSQSKSAASPSVSAGHSEADQHLDAIQDILSKAKDGKLDKEQTDQIKTHLDQLRQLLAQSK
jgi:hypothetical protein